MLGKMGIPKSMIDSKMSRIPYGNILSGALGSTYLMKITEFRNTTISYFKGFKSINF
jgi:hypothetical protein